MSWYLLLTFHNLGINLQYSNIFHHKNTEQTNKQTNCFSLTKKLLNMLLRDSTQINTSFIERTHTDSFEFLSKQPQQVISETDCTLLATRQVRMRTNVKPYLIFIFSFILHIVSSVN